jgi:hypothetical protein
MVIVPPDLHSSRYSLDESLIREHARLAGLPISRVEEVRRLLGPSAFGTQEPIPHIQDLGTQSR